MSELDIKPGETIPRIMLEGDEARQFSLKCADCGGRDVVYFISFPLGDLFPAGAYCYKCLVKRCRLTRVIPFPINQELLNKLKRDIGVSENTPPIRLIRR